MLESETTTAAASLLTDDELRQAYRVAVRSRTVEEFIVRLVNKGEVSFAIWGPGEEIHGTSMALALSRVVNKKNFGIVPHYRSGCLCSMWCELSGKSDFTLDLLRQQFSKPTDSSSGGRQMVYHLNLPDVGILPVQSPVGMQLGKAAGYAKGFQLLGIKDGIAIAIIGDGTSAESDLHEAMSAASVWNLPVMFMITDNGVAISTLPEEGRGIKDFARYAESFGIRPFSSNGSDFFDTYDNVLAAATYVVNEQKPVLFHVKNLVRFNGHSSAADVTFDLEQPDPLIEFGKELVRRGILEEADILSRKPGEGRDFFAHHEPGRIMQEEIETTRTLIRQVREEPDVDPSTVMDFIRPPFPNVVETETSGQTNITYAGAVRSALDHIMTSKGGALWGQDVGRLGGVMTATAGLKARHPNRVTDSPLNEPLIVGTACGAGLHEGVVALPEIQFGDYSLNTFHWLVHLGNLYWSTNGQSTSSVILRMPVDPFGGGAMYHSMSVDGYFAPIPGLVIVMPSTSVDAFGLLMTAAEYDGPVVVLEPKFIYRLALGKAFPGEPTDKDAVRELKNLIRGGGVPDIDPSVRVPFSKAAIRRPGNDVTIVAWGRAVTTALQAATTLAATGIDAEVIDLRTLVPPDFETIKSSLRKTGRLVVASEDRPFAGFVRSIQGAMVEHFPGLPSRVVGQLDVPGVAQAPLLEQATVLNATRIESAVHEVLNTKTEGTGSGFAWIPPRYFRG